MPACTTPELCPVWCAATSGSFSSTTTGTPAPASRRATASPTMPAPMIPTGAASVTSFLASANGSVIGLSREYPALSRYSAASLWRRAIPNQRCHHVSDRRVLDRPQPLRPQQAPDVVRAELRLGNHRRLSSRSKLVTGRGGCPASGGQGKSSKLRRYRTDAALRPYRPFAAQADGGDRVEI